VHPASAPPGLEGLPFEFDIAMGVRRGDKALRDELDAIIERRRAELDAILAEYSVPRPDRPGEQRHEGNARHRARAPRRGLRPGEAPLLETAGRGEPGLERRMPRPTCSRDKRARE
jgi:hypothetical protein